MIVSTYQAASGAGAAAMEELRAQTKDVLEGKEAKPEIFPFQVCFVREIRLPCLLGAKTGVVLRLHPF